MPLSASTKPLHYLSPGEFDRERAQIFSRMWIFAGMANEIPNPNDYLRARIAGREIIVQNGSGTIRAFLNSCSHRHSHIHEAPCGNRKLICPYHGWSYNDEGIPTGIPAKENFPQVCANPAQFALQQFEVALAGHFIFVRLIPGGPDLKIHLGHAHEFLVNASTGLHRNMDEFQGTITANWKVVIENALEGYHVGMVHRTTLGAIKQLSVRKQDVVDHLPADSGHSYMINRANEEWLKKWRRYERALGLWPFKFDHYVHQLIFPNLTVTSFMGYSFHIQCFQPDAVGKTTVHSRIYSVNCKEQTAKGESIMRTVYEEGKRFTRKVFSEDQHACELTYLGIHDAEKSAVLAEDLEKRIAHFQKAYLLSMERQSETPDTSVSRT